MNTFDAHRAILKASTKDVFDGLEKIALRNGFDSRRGADTLEIHAPLGDVTCQVHGTETEVTFAAKSAAELQMLKDLYAQRFAKLGIDKDIRWSAPTARMPLNQTVAKVVNCQQISPNFARVRLAGDFAAFAKPGAGLHFRLLLNDQRSGWPELDENGLTFWPGGIETWHRPPYTVRRIGPKADWIDVDIVLHAGGRVTEWTKTVQPGQEIALHGPSGSKQPDTKHLLLFGDETAMPVILRMIEDAPEDTQGAAVVAVRDPTDAQLVETQSGIKVRWIDMADTNDLFEELTDFTRDYPNAFVFFAAERNQATRVREHLKGTGLSPKLYKAASYWTKP